MKLDEIVEITNGSVLTKCDGTELDFECAMASDLMSDVLTLETENCLLITGLANLQTIRTAEMSDVHCIILARNKKASEEMVALADRVGIIIMETVHSMFHVSGLLYDKGLKPIY